jgi:glycosyltransferase involved in cell wall biosynthesis
LSGVADGPHVLLFPQRRFPSDHAMLETVYTRRLPERGYRVSWVMERGPGAPEGATASWNGTDVELVSAGSTAPRFLRARWRAQDRLDAAERCHARRPVDLIQVRNELSSASAALKLSRRWGIPFVYQLSFPTANPLELDPTAPHPSLKQRVSIAMSRIYQWRVLQRADLVLAISNAMRDDLVRRGLRADRVVGFPLGADTTVSPSSFDRQAERRALGLDDVPTMLYFGSTDRARKLEFLLDMAERVRSAMPEARLLVVGSSTRASDDAWLRDEVESRRLGGMVRLVPSVPRADVPRWLAAANVSISPIPPVPMYVVSSPTKVVESLAMAIPVVANREIPDQVEVIGGSGGGEAVPYDSGAFADAAVRFLRSPAIAQAAGRQGRTWVEAYRSYGRMADLVEQWYAKLFAERKPAGQLPGMGNQE